LRKLIRNEQPECLKTVSQVWTEDFVSARNGNPIYKFSWRDKDCYDESLLKPDVDDYQFDDYFIANYKTGELEPLPSAPDYSKYRAEITIRLYGLNIAARNKARIREMERFIRDSQAFLDDYKYRFFLE